jgi:putative transposase
LIVPKNSLYYAPVPEKPENINMMDIMDRHLLQHPIESVISMVDMLKEKGYPVGPKGGRRLCKVMGYKAITGVEISPRTL